MFLELDGQGPHYAQLTRALKSAMLNGRLPAGTRLPSSRTLALELALSRITVTTAYEQLRAEGYIHARVGSGSYVSDLRVDQQTNPLPKLSGRHLMAPPSRFADRARRVRDGSIATPQHELRFVLRYGMPLLNPSLGITWGRELAKAAARVSPTFTAMQGLPTLREQICHYLAARRGIRTTPERVLIVTGTQQALDLTARVLVDEGNTVAIEDPHYFSVRQQLAAHGARLFPVTTDDEGLVCAALPGQAPRFVLVTPSHQFPSGSVLSLPRRLELLRYAERQSCWIVENDYDSEFRYDSKPLAALHSLDRADRVIYVGSFSKVMFGTLRLGYMVLPESLCEDFIDAKNLCDSCNSMIPQAAMASFMKDGGFERHLRYATNELRARRKVLIEELHRHAGNRVRISDSQAGMHVVAWLPGYDHAQVEMLIAHANERGLGLYSVAPHYATRPATPGLLLGYSSLARAELRDAMRLLGECLDAIDTMASIGTANRQMPLSSSLPMVCGQAR